MHIVFVTTELSPQLPGGAGTVVAGLRDRLVDRGDRVTVLLVADTDTDLPDWVRVAGGGADAEARSRAAADGLRALVAEDPPDLIEFQDFDGLAFHALAHRPEVSLERIPVQVRFHAPFDLIFEAIGVDPPWLAATASMERSAFRMADRVVVPSPPIGRLVAGRYGVEPERIAVGVPPMEPPAPLNLNPAPTPLIVALGRLGEQKGSHDLVAAAVPVLREHPDLRLRFIGEDGWSAGAGLPMREWLETELVPSDVAERIEFTGRLEGELRDRRLAEAWAVVFPSRFESFSLAAHEARAGGLPVIVSDLPAFEGLLHEGTGALVYDGTRDGLTAALRRIVEDDDLRRRLAAAPPPDYGDPLAPYGADVPVRHQRSQAGLGTAAVQRLEEVAASPPDATPGLAQRALRLLPEPVARAAVVLLPQRLKDRFRAVADWRIEQERRAEAVRNATLASRIAAGEFADLDRPRASVVIPCFNQGRFLGGAIQSVFEQTMNSFEVIVVDDGSTDAETVALIDGLDWPRIRVIRQQNRGLPAARNAGMRAARGEFVVPLDADDELAPGFLEATVAALDADPGAAFACCRARLFGDVDAIWVPRQYNRYQLLLSNSVVGCVLLRRTAWNGVGGYDETMRNGNEDWELWVRLMEAGWDVAELDEPLFRYRKHGISMSVVTEARFEDGRSEIVERHPGLYEPEPLSARKRDHYPLLSILLPQGSEAPKHDDAEIITVGALTDAVRMIRGKYAVHWDGIEDGGSDTLDRLADHLEAHPDLGAVATGTSQPIVMVRRWSLLDPAGPSARDRLDLPGSGRDQLAPGAFPDPAWMVPDTIDGVPVQRQRPEEEGRLPTWVTA